MHFPPKKVIFSLLQRQKTNNIRALKKSKMQYDASVR